MTADSYTVLEGWLLKSPPEKKLVRARWTKRWFVLKESGRIPGQYVLEYYNTPKQHKKHQKPRRTIDLDQCEQVDANVPFEPHAEHQFMFSLHTLERRYFLMTETEEDMLRWVHSLCRACGLQRDGDSTTSGSEHDGLTNSSMNDHEQQNIDHHNDHRQPEFSSPSQPSTGSAGAASSRIFNNSNNNNVHSSANKSSSDSPLLIMSSSDKTPNFANRHATNNFPPSAVSTFPLMPTSTATAFTSSLVPSFAGAEDETSAGSDATTITAAAPSSNVATITGASKRSPAFGSASHSTTVKSRPPPLSLHTTNINSFSMLQSAQNNNNRMHAISKNFAEQQLNHARQTSLPLAPQPPKPSLPPLLPLNADKEFFVADANWSRNNQKYRRNGSESPYFHLHDFRTGIACIHTPLSSHHQRRPSSSASHNIRRGGFDSGSSFDENDAAGGREIMLPFDDDITGEQYAVPPPSKPIATSGQQNNSPTGRNNIATTATLIAGNMSLSSDSSSVTSAAMHEQIADGDNSNSNLLHTIHRKCSEQNSYTKGPTTTVTISSSLVLPSVASAALVTQTKPVVPLKPDFLLSTTTPPLKFKGEHASGLPSPPPPPPSSATTPVANNTSNTLIGKNGNNKKFIVAEGVYAAPMEHIYDEKAAMSVENNDTGLRKQPSILNVNNSSNNIIMAQSTSSTSSLSMMRSSSVNINSALVNSATAVLPRGRQPQIQSSLHGPITQPRGGALVDESAVFGNRIADSSTTNGPSRRYVKSTVMSHAPPTPPAPTDSTTLLYDRPGFLLAKQHQLAPVEQALVTNRKRFDDADGGGRSGGSGESTATVIIYDKPPPATAAVRLVCDTTDADCDRLKSYISASSFDSQAGAQLASVYDSPASLAVAISTPPSSLLLPQRVSSRNVRMTGKTDELSDNSSSSSDDDEEEVSTKDESDDEQTDSAAKNNNSQRQNVPPISRRPWALSQQQQYNVVHAMGTFSARASAIDMARSEARVAHDLRIEPIISPTTFSSPSSSSSSLMTAAAGTNNRDAAHSHMHSSSRASIGRSQRVKSSRRTVNEENFATNNMQSAATTRIGTVTASKSAPLVSAVGNNNNADLEYVHVTASKTPVNTESAGGVEYLAINAAATTGRTTPVAAGSSSNAQAMRGTNSNNNNNNNQSSPTPNIPPRSPLISPGNVASQQQHRRSSSSSVTSPPAAAPVAGVEAAALRMLNRNNNNNSNMQAAIGSSFTVGRPSHASTRSSTSTISGMTTVGNDRRAAAVVASGDQYHEIDGILTDALRHVRARSNNNAAGNNINNNNVNNNNGNVASNSSVAARASVSSSSGTLR